jgi:hypothetical protein
MPNSSEGAITTYLNVFGLTRLELTTSRSIADDVLNKAAVQAFIRGQPDVLPKDGHAHLFNYFDLVNKLVYLRSLLIEFH